MAQKNKSNTSGFCSSLGEKKKTEIFNLKQWENQWGSKASACSGATESMVEGPSAVKTREGGIHHGVTATPRNKVKGINQT